MITLTLAGDVGAFRRPGRFGSRSRCCLDRSVDLVALALSRQATVLISGRSVGLVASLLVLPVPFAVATGPGRRHRHPCDGSSSCWPRRPAESRRHRSAHSSQPAAFACSTICRRNSWRYRSRTLPVLGERRRMPDRVIDPKADEPAEQQVVVGLLHQHPLRTDAVEDLSSRARSRRSGAIDTRRSS